MDDEGYFEAELQLENAQRSKFDVLVIVQELQKQQAKEAKKELK